MTSTPKACLKTGLLIENSILRVFCFFESEILDYRTLIVILIDDTKIKKSILIKN